MIPFQILLHKSIERSFLHVTCTFDMLCHFRYDDKIDIFGGEPLGIFKVPESEAETSDAPPELTTWHRLEARELRLAVTHPPSNIFEEMIQWTEQGKLWHFPVNNEQGL